MKTTEKADGTIVQIGDDQYMKNLQKQYPNILGYAEDIGKIKDGEKTGEGAFTVLVKRKVPKTLLKPEEMIPQRIHGKQTDVLEVGDVKAELSPAEYQKYYEKPPMAVSWANLKQTAGTGGGPVLLNGKLCLGTNTHVACESVRKNLSEQCRDCTQPGPHDGGTGIRGYVPKAIIMPVGQTAYNDFAIVIGVNGTELNPETLGTKTIPRGLTTLKVGDRVWKEGRTTALTQGEVLSVNATVNVGYSEGTITHARCILMTNMSAGGDSGSWYYKKVSEGNAITNEDKYVAAYGFAGSSSVTVCHELENALNAVGAILCVQEPGDDEPLEKDVEVNFTLQEDEVGEMYRVYGQVKKTNGDPVNAATITFNGRETMTNESGGYEFKGVEEGKYTISAWKEGFKKEEKEVIIGNPPTKKGLWGFLRG